LGRLRSRNGGRILAAFLRFVEAWLLVNVDLSGLSAVAPLLNAMALLIALAGAWLLLATRWRRQLAASVVPMNCRYPALAPARAASTRRLDRFFYAFGFASLALAWLLSSLTQLI